MLILGSHVSYKNDTQLVGSVKEALSYGSNTFMFYTGAPQNTQRGTINDLLTIDALNLMKENNIALENVICHAPYIVNLANNQDLEKYQFAQDFLRNEINRCETLGVRYIVLHPGSATKLERSYAIDNIVNGINNVLVEEDNIVILLETMAGKGTELGINIDEIKYIIDHINFQDKVGVCLDTCHLNDSGIDIAKFDDYLSEFESKIGLNKIGCIHVNDSKNPINSHKDRHENLGFGTIGWDNLLNVIYHPSLENVPKILETPYVNRDFAPYKQEIEAIKNKQFNPNLYEDILNYYHKN
ncbi:MAG: deoxyribonuclease IV [Bacilli bacterium]|jgi:deoxyribonuclease-4|nr:deoxyribonuclease IV [Bacilli bacterium]